MSGDRRIDGLDAWRAALMLGGLLMHATCGQEPRPLFDGIVLVSASFRMGAFFMISGYLNGLALERRAPGAWLSRRVVQIGVPTAFGLTVICPLITLVLFDQPYRFDWHHLWFLVALLLYAALAWLVCRVPGARGLGDRLSDRYGGGARVRLLVPLVVGTASLALMVLTIQFALLWAPPRWLPLMWQLRLIVGYAPVYLLGLGMAQAPRLRAALLASVALPAAIVAATVLAYVLRFWLPGRTASLGDPVALLGACFCPPAAGLLILRSAQAVRRVPRLLRTLQEASFTVYIVHYPLLIAINLVFARIAWSPYAEYAVAVAAGGALSVWFHVALVRRSPILGLLLNGRPPVRSGERVKPEQAEQRRPRLRRIRPQRG